MLDNSLGRKMAMPVTGMALLAFVLLHLLGNSTLFYGPDGINAYALALHRFGFLLWALRLCMFTVLLVHIFFGIQLTLANRAAKPQAYAVRTNRASTLAGRSMIWSGLLIGGFIFFHLLHFTFQIFNPELAAIRHADSQGRPDIFMMVVFSFKKQFVALIYLSALTALGLHLMHSIQGAAQTLGLNNERTLPKMLKAGILAALLIFLGYAAFPLSVITGLLK